MLILHLRTYVHIILNWLNERKRDKEAKRVWVFHSARTSVACVCVYMFDFCRFELSFPFDVLLYRTVSSFKYTTRTHNDRTYDMAKWNGKWTGNCLLFRDTHPVCVSNTTFNESSVPLYLNTSLCVIKHANTFNSRFDIVVSVKMCAHIASINTSKANKFNSH